MKLSFSDFIRNATPEEKKEVMLEVAKEAIEEQKKTMNQSISEEFENLWEKMTGSKHAALKNKIRFEQFLQSKISKALTAERKELRDRLEKYDIVPPQVKMENPYYWEGCQYAVKKIISLLEEK